MRGDFRSRGTFSRIARPGVVNPLSFYGLLWSASGNVRAFTFCILITIREAKKCASV